MSFEIKHKTKVLLCYITCIVLFLIFQAASMILGRTPLANLSGVFSAFQYGVCLSLVRTNKKRGIITSLILLGASLLNLVITIIASGMQAPFAGLFNVLFYMVTITWLGAIFAKQEKNAVTDIVTGLLNRRGLYQLLNSLIENEKPFHLIYLDIENFKLLNDSFGHVSGDLILKKTTKILQDYFGDRGIITRSGAEFAIILKDTDDAEKEANNILQKLSEKMSISEGSNVLDFYLSVFAGMSSYPKDSTNYEELINFADMAMYEAVKKNSTTAVVFEPKMEETAKRQMELEHLIK